MCIFFSDYNIRLTFNKSFKNCICLQHKVLYLVFCCCCFLVMYLKVPTTTTCSATAHTLASSFLSECFVKQDG